MRKGISEPITLALIALLASLITSYVEYKTDNQIAKYIYVENNETGSRQFPKTIITDEDNNGN